MASARERLQARVVESAARTVRETATERAALSAELRSLRADHAQVTAERDALKTQLADAIEISATNRSRAHGTDSYMGVETMRQELVLLRAKLRAAQQNFSLLSTHARGVEATNLGLGTEVIEFQHRVEEAETQLKEQYALQRSSADAARAERERAAREVRALVMHVHRLEEALGRSRREASEATARQGGGVSAQLRALCADNEVLGAYALQLERELSQRSEQQRRLLLVERALLASKKEALNLAQGIERTRIELSAAHEHVQTLEASVEQLRAEIAFLNDQLEETEARRAQQECRADAELDAKQRAEARCEQLDAELTHVTERLQERDQELASVKQQLAALNAEHTALGERLVAEESAHASTKAKVHEDKASTLKKKGKFLAERLRESAEAYDAAEAAARDNPFVQDQEKQKKWTKLRQLVERGIKQEKEKMERKLKKQEEVIERLFREAERRQVQVQDLEEKHAREDDLAFDESRTSHYHRGTPRGKNRKQYRTDSDASRISSSDESSAYGFSPRTTEELANQSTASLESLAKNQRMQQKLKQSSSRTARSRHSQNLGRSKLAATGQHTPGST